MFIKEMTADEWEGSRDMGLETDNPTWEQVEQAVRQLDGEKKTYIAITDEEYSETYMSIGGGNSGLYLVELSIENTRFFALVDSSKSMEDKVYLVTGGQGSEMPARWCVNLEMALQAFKTYAESGTLDESLVWEEH